MKYLKHIVFTLLVSSILISCSNSRVYEVKRGDSLYSISKKKNITIDHLRKINNLHTNTLYPGQKIYLKGNTPTSSHHSTSSSHSSSNRSHSSSSSHYKGSYHTVVSGDTLYGISTKFNVTIDNLKKVNNLRSTTLHKGQRIYLGKVISKNTNYKSTSHTTHTSSTSDSYTNHSRNSILKNFHKPLKVLYVTSPFGYRDHPVLGRRILHTGVDLRAVMNTPIYSPYHGVVTYAGWMNGYGKIVIINNGNSYETRFAHLNRILVKKGQKVGRGQVIAKSGKTGRVTGPHLHYEIRYKGTPMDPMTLYK